MPTSRDLDEIRRAQSIVSTLVEGGIDPYQSKRHSECVAYLILAQTALEYAERAIKGQGHKRVREPYHGSAAEGNC